MAFSYQPGMLPPPPPPNPLTFSEEKLLIHRKPPPPTEIEYTPEPAWKFFAVVVPIVAMITAVVWYFDDPQKPRPRSAASMQAEIDDLRERVSALEKSP